jgi:toxin ParE1/3/4
VFEDLNYEELKRRANWPPKSAPACDHSRQGYRRRNVERYMIYLRVTDYGIGIICILHERMDAPHHL